MSLLAAISIAKAVGLDDWLGEKLRGSDNKAAKVATQVIDFATQVTGANTPEQALTKLNADPTLAAQLKQSLINNAHELAMAPYQDRQNARAMHNKHPEQADKIAERIMKYNLWFIGGLIIAQCIAVYFLQDKPSLLTVISNLVGIALKTLFDERKEVCGFYFGSSMGSKSKDNPQKFITKEQ